jgi:hypothetical protein
LRLTDISIRALEAPAKGVVVYTDDVLAGFGVRVRSMHLEWMALIRHLISRHKGRSMKIRFEETKTP